MAKIQNHKYQQKETISRKTNNLQSNIIIYIVRLKLTSGLFPLF